MRFPILPALLGLLVLSAPVFAQAPLSLADLRQDAKLTAAFDDMAKGHEIPAWVREDAVTSPAGRAAFEGQDYLVLTGCKKNDCAANQIALLYNPETGQMFGLLASGEPEKSQNLQWLNIGGNAESIDGRTILFAATTGSLDNHPDAFDYRDSMAPAAIPVPAPKPTASSPAETPPAPKPKAAHTTPPVAAPVAE